MHATSNFSNVLATILFEVQILKHSLGFPFRTIPRKGQRYDEYPMTGIAQHVKAIVHPLVLLTSYNSSALRTPSNLCSIVASPSMKAINYLVNH